MTDLYTHAVDTLKTVFSEALELTSGDVAARLLDLLMELRIQTRLYYVGDNLVREMIWPALREHEAVLDLVVSMSVDWHPRFSSLHATHSAIHPEKVYSHLTQLLAGGFTHLTPRDMLKSVTGDEPFIEKLTKPEDLCRLFLSESWLVVLVLMTRNLTYFKPLLEAKRNA